MKNNNAYYTAIHYTQFDKLLEIAGNDAKARFLDKIIFWFKISKFTLPRSNSEDIWFTRTYLQMHDETRIPVSTLKMYMSEFVKRGYLERAQRKMGTSVKAYFRITNKLATKLAITAKKTCIPTRDEKKLTPTHTSKNTSFVLPINKDKDIKININTIKPLQGCGKKRYGTTDSIEAIFNQVGERLTETQKTTVWAAIQNLKNQHNKKHLGSAEFVAWICFSLIHAKNQLKSAKTFSHQLNTLMKIARSSKGLNQPRGFNNHWDIGRDLKQKKETKLKQHELKKLGKVGESQIFIVAKKEKEIWGQQGELSKLRAEKSKLLVERSAIISEDRAINRLFAKDEEQKKIQLMKNKEKLESVCLLLSKTEIRIQQLKEDKQHSQNQQWEPLYG